MAFEADRGLSTVLGGPRDEYCRVPRAWSMPGNSATPSVGSRWRMQAEGRQIRNPKSEISTARMDGNS